MKRKYRLIRGTEILLWTVAVGLIAFYLCRLGGVNPNLATAIALAWISASVFIGSQNTRVFSVNEKDLARYLNRHYPSLQESADLLLRKDEDLSGLELLQRERTAQQFEKIYSTIRLPHRLGRAIGVFVLSIISSAALTAFSNQSKSPGPDALSSPALLEVTSEDLPVNIKSTVITISPPSYTQIKRKSSTNFNLKMPEGSTVVWDIIFERSVFDPLIIFSGKDSTRMTRNEKGYRIQKTFNAAAFYQLIWTNPDSSKQFSNYYEIDVIKDHAPVATVENLNQFILLSEKDSLKIDLKTKLTDDYGLSQAHIIATVSKGSGEAIKFREEKIRFDRPQKIVGKQVTASKILDLIRLGLQPGDELYFHIAVEDNKTPAPNYTRTETYFIELQDTTSVVSSADVGLGVDLMPEYFRSQRQIIIDSEKLLREKKRITKENFNSRSNDLAHDQKVLRLRYGEFLGEEFQSSIGPQSPITEEQAEDVEKTFGHSHDSENEHNHVEEKGPSNNPSKSAGDKKSSTLDDFVHAHDGEQEATFFIQSIKAKLKAAVTIMWDAELYLRLYQPEKSLPYQYKALKLLKEVSQDSRIYVHRTGFDPPPLKEEQRLTGDLNDIQNSTTNERMEVGKQYPYIRAALSAIEKLLQQTSVALTPEVKDVLTRAGQELGVIALQKPGSHLQTLSLLNAVIHERSSEPKKNSLIKIRESFWKILPREPMTPQARSIGTHHLDLQFLKNLELSNP